jgi:hypothetical protein
MARSAWWLLILTLATSACSRDTPSRSASDSAAPAVDSSAGPPPWHGPRLSSRDVQPAYRAEWSKAENRGRCALVAFAQPVGTPRAATFSGGWGIAYDTANTRSAYGVAGTGVNAADASYNEWPYKRAWSDGSTAGYGPEGGSGPNQLAYVQIAGQGCLYNVWSRLGVAHLEMLLGQLRFVETP